MSIAQSKMSSTGASKGFREHRHLAPLVRRLLGRHRGDRAPGDRVTASEKLKALDSHIHSPIAADEPMAARFLLGEALQQIVAVVEWLEMYADAKDWHAYVGSKGGRMDEEVDALLAALGEALT